jgi:hypothetical protein
MQPAQGAARLDLRALVAFFALAYALSWSWVIPLAAAHQVVHRGAVWPTHYPALLGPAIAAVVVTAWTMGSPGLRDLGARLVRWRVAPRWWLVAVSPAAFWHGVYNFVGATQAATGTLAVIVSTLIMVQGIILVVLELRARRRGLPSVLGPP